MTDAYTQPTREQLDAFRGLSHTAPIDLINLVRFRDDAAYPDGHELAGTGLTGADAFVRFIAQSGQLFSRVGDRMVWSGLPEQVLIGPPGERWDAAYIVSYPSADAFLGMIGDPIHAQAEAHRRAAVATTQIIRCAPRENDEDFAWP